MEDSFKLTVTYKGEERVFDLQHVTGYFHGFQVNVDGVTVLYKPKRDGSYRAQIDCETLDKTLKPNGELIILLADRIQEQFPEYPYDDQDTYPPDEPERLVMEIVKIEFPPVPLGEEDEAISED